MRSPLKDGNVKFKFEKWRAKYRGEYFDCLQFYYVDYDDGVEFTTTPIDEINYYQLVRKYRERHRRKTD